MKLIHIIPFKKIKLLKKLNLNNNICYHLSDDRASYENFREKYKDNIEVRNLSGLFSDAITRRRTLKAISYKLPCRFTLKLFYILIIKCGILDGKMGFQYALMLAKYEKMIVKYSKENL